MITDNAAHAANIAAAELPPALDADRRVLSGLDTRVYFYAAGLEHVGHKPPLLLIHSINAAASAYEIKPLFDHYRHQRPVIAVDLPGYGLSERPERLYTPRLMTDTLHALLDYIDELHDGFARTDALAVSLSCEFLARAAVESPKRFRSVALVSPTGFNGTRRQDGPTGATRGRDWIYKTLTGAPRVGRSLFALLTTKPSIRFFLQKTWGSKNIDEGAFQYAWLTAHQPNAQFAPFSFLSGYLFSADINRVYESLSMPVWMGHGNRGDFTDYGRKTSVEDRPNWSVHEFDTGALPHFELLEEFTADYDRFAAREPLDGS